jgi:drug/metabolite transporter (DMT)-like permease
MNNQLTNFLQLAFAIIIMSSSGALGRYIELPPPIIIWTRCIIGALALFIFLKIRKFNLNIGWGSHFWILLASSLLLGLHWITYFYSLQLSNVAIGMLSLFTYPVITTLLEPIMLKVKFDYSNLILAIIALVGVSLLVPELNIENDYTLGILLGTLSALFYSVRNILLKKNITDHSGITSMFYQVLILVLVLWPVLFMFDFDPVQGASENWEALLILGLFTTAIGHTVFVLSFKHFSISTVSVISALTPLIGTLLGYIFLNEMPSGRTFIGGAIIFFTVTAESIRSIRQKVNT